MNKPTIGVIGMAVMGKNLALNIESRGYTVAIYNRTNARTEKVAWWTKRSLRFGSTYFTTNCRANR